MAVHRGLDAGEAGRHRPLTFCVALRSIMSGAQPMEALTRGDCCAAPSSVNLGGNRKVPVGARAFICRSRVALEGFVPRLPERRAHVPAAQRRVTGCAKCHNCLRGLGREFNPNPKLCRRQTMTRRSPGVWGLTRQLARFSIRDCCPLGRGSEVGRLLRCSRARWVFMSTFGWLRPSRRAKRCRRPVTVCSSPNARVRTPMVTEPT
jgi:hypothetical protein